MVVVPSHRIHEPFTFKKLVVRSMGPSQPPYTPHPHHRNKTPLKGQWQISDKDEIAAFAKAWFSGWRLEIEAWGLYFRNGKPDYLGVTEDHTTRTFFAKFVRDPNHNMWHGYPANQRNKQDVPDLGIADMWIKAKVLPPAKIRKLIRRQSCSL
jgi:hypothetical protein